MDPYGNGVRLDFPVDLDFRRDRKLVEAVLSLVPHQYTVTFAVRSARRVAPLILHPGTPEAVEWLDVVESALDMLVRWVGGDPTSEFRRRRALGDCSAARHVGGFAPRTPRAAINAGASAATYFTHADDTASRNAFLVSHSCDAAVHATDATTDVVPAVRADFNRLRAVQSPNGWQDDRPVPADFFGPLWVGEEPEWSREGWAKLKAYREERAKPILPPPELFEREPEGIGPLSDEMKASLVDRKWIESELDAGRLLEYSGQCIAVIDRRVVGVGGSQLALIHEVAERLGVLRCRVAVTYID